jgi:hypothetical protein
MTESEERTPDTPDEDDAGAPPQPGITEDAPETDVDVDDGDDNGGDGEADND